MMAIVTCKFSWFLDPASSCENDHRTEYQKVWTAEKWQRSKQHADILCGFVARMERCAWQWWDMSWRLANRTLAVWRWRMAVWDAVWLHCHIRSYHYNPLQATFDLSVECTPQSMVVKMKPAFPSVFELGVLRRALCCAMLYLNAWQGQKTRKIKSNTFAARPTLVLTYLHLFDYLNVSKAFGFDDLVVISKSISETMRPKAP